MKNHYLLYGFLAIVFCSLVGIGAAVYLVGTDRAEEVVGEEERLPENLEEEIVGEAEEYQPTAEQRAEYLQTLQTPMVQFIRQVFDAYVAGTMQEEGLDESVVKSHDLGETMSGFESFDKDYFSSPFLVYTVNPGAMFGGVEYAIFFKDKPDKMFIAWIYDMQEEGLDFRGFWQASKISQEQMMEIVAESQYVFEDEELWL